MNLFKCPKKNTKRDLQNLKKWSENLPHLKFNADEEWLLVFLNNCKFNGERAKRKIETFYIIRHTIPELFHNRDPNLPKIQEILRNGLLVPVRLNDINQTVLRFSFGDPDRYALQLMMKVYLMTLDVLLYEEGTKFLEYDVLVDLKQFSPKYEEKISANMLKMFLTYFEDGYPLNVSKVHFVNPQPHTMPLLNLLLMLTSEKNRNKIHVHCENEDFDVARIYPMLAPVFEKDDDGCARVFNDVCVEWKLKMESYRKWLMHSSFLSDVDMAQRPPDGRNFLNPFRLETTTAP